MIAEYADEIKLIEDMSEMMKKSTTFDRDDLLLQDAVALFMKELEDMMSFIESQRNHYDIQKEIFLKYNGTDVGYDPFYNFKNVTHSSY